ncbi:exocyst complex component 7-like isoform X2 [Lineus longissimus]|uniref:exocyst complex component 7-like isoform X2 n=1 Tax=Lineus longissimus TaxID=88925 RepID=UPI00315C730B
MDDFEARKYEIDVKLDRETTNLALLKESLDKSDNMTKNMLSILDTFNNRLRKLEATITPVYQETGNLQRRQENIDKSLCKLDNVLSFYHVAKEADPIIREGPSSGLETYLDCMAKLRGAVNYFTEDNPGSPELSTVSNLYETGKDNLEREFSSLLKRHSKPVTPVAVLNMIGTDEELPSDKRPESVCSAGSILGVEHISDRVVEELVQITKWLVDNRASTEFMNVYATVRSNNLMKTLQGFQDFIPMKRYETLTAKMRGAKDTPTRRTSKRVATFARKSTSLIRGSIHSLPIDPSGLKRQPSFSLDIKEEGSEIDIEIYMSCISALLKLAQSENQLLMRILPHEYQRKTFDLLIQSSLESIVNEGEQIAISARKLIAKHDFSGLLSIFPVVKHLRSVKVEFIQTLEGCQAPTRHKLTSLMDSLSTTGAKALESFIENIRNDSDKQSNMPKDGTVHELANNVLIFLEQLMDYGETAGAMLLEQEAKTTPTDLKRDDIFKHKLADYINKVLCALNLNLCNKSNCYGETLKAVFILNNYNYVLTSMKRSGVLEALTAYNKDVEKYYNEQLLEHMRLYSQSWSRVLHYIYEPSKPASLQKTPSPESGKLKDKERQTIKDKFAGFNKEMEELFRTQKTYASPDPELRAKLTKDNKDFILPKYRSFLEKYMTMNFSKTPDKYTKYSADDVSYMIDQFFEGAM